MTMKKSVLYLLAAVATMTLAACSNDDNANVPDGATPIQLQASLLSINTRAAQNIQNEQFEKDEELNIYIHEIVPAGSKNGASYSTLPYQYKVTDPETGALKPQALSSPYYPINKNHVSITSLYPNTVQNVNGQWFKVAYNQYTKANYKASDLMVSTNLKDQEFSSSPVQLQYQHKLCKINVTLEMYHEEGQDVDNDPLKNSEVVLKNVKCEIFYSQNTDALSDARDVHDVVVTSDGYYPSSAIIVPQDIQATNFIRIKVGKDILNYTLPTPVTFESGKAYTFNIKVKQDALVVQAFEMENWNDSPAAVNKTLQFEN